MTVPDDLRKRLTLLGETPEQFSEIYETRGPDFFLSFLRLYIEGREETISRFREWSPKLREYATHCRSRSPSPDLKKLSDQDRAKLPIYEAKITGAERIRPKDNNCIIICSIPSIGIPVAQRLWPGHDSLSIILTLEESRQWWEMYKHPEGALWCAMND